MARFGLARHLWCSSLLALQAGCALPRVRGPEAVAPPPALTSDLVPVRYEEPADTLPVPPRKLDELPSARKLDEAAPAEDVTLDQAINATLLNDPKIRAGLEAVAQAGGDALTASLAPNPILSVNQTLLPLTRPFTPQRTGGPPQLDVGVVYPIDWWLFGKRAAAMAAGALGVKAGEAAFADLIRRRVRDASQEYYNALEAKALRNLARDDLKTKERTEGFVREAREAGGKADIDLDLLRLEIRLARQALREAEAGVASSLARLRALMGRRDFGPMDVAGNLRDAPDEPIPDLRDAVALARQNRPDIVSDHWKVAQADAQARVEGARARPDVNARLGYTRQFQEKAIGAPDADSWGVGVDVSLPLINRNQGNRLKARSLAGQRRHELEGDVIDLHAEIDLILIEYRTAVANAGFYAGEHLKQSRQTRDKAEEAFRLGSRTLVEVFDAQRGYRDIVRASINNRAAAWRALYKLRSATGCGLRPAAGK